MQSNVQKSNQVFAPGVAVILTFFLLICCATFQAYTSALADVTRISVLVSHKQGFPRVDQP